MWAVLLNHLLSVQIWTTYSKLKIKGTIWIGWFKFFQFGFMRNFNSVYVIFKHNSEFDLRGRLKSCIPHYIVTAVDTFICCFPLKCVLDYFNYLTYFLFIHFEFKILIMQNAYFIHSVFSILFLNIFISFLFPFKS